MLIMWRGADNTVELFQLRGCSYGFTKLPLWKPYRKCAHHIVGSINAVIYRFIVLKVEYLTQLDICY